MIILKKLLLGLAAGLSLLGAFGCEREGPMERAGEKMDEAGRETRETFEK